MKTIELTQGYTALIDDADYDMINKHKWCAVKYRHYVYAVRKVNKKMVPMHRIILNIADPKVFVDHKDGNGINNQRNNIRICSNAQNQHNQRPRKKRTSKYIGVCAVHRFHYKYWRAHIRVNNKSIQLADFPFTEEGELMAAKKRDEAVKKYHGEFGRLNFPE